MHRALWTSDLQQARTFDDKDAADSTCETLLGAFGGEAEVKEVRLTLEVG